MTSPPAPRKRPGMQNLSLVCQGFKLWTEGSNCFGGDEMLTKDKMSLQPHVRACRSCDALLRATSCSSLWQSGLWSTSRPDNLAKPSDYRDVCLSTDAFLVIAECCSMAAAQSWSITTAPSCWFCSCALAIFWLSELYSLVNARSQHMRAYHLYMHKYGQNTMRVLYLMPKILIKKSLSFFIYLFLLSAVDGWWVRSVLAAIQPKENLWRIINNIFMQWKRKNGRTK